jgi:DNA helicase-2/ATP-dependent DNA helicase PcrA
MKDRTNSIAGHRDIKSRVEFRTFHSFCLALVNENFHLLNLPSKPTICTKNISHQLLIESLKTHNVDFDSKKLNLVKKAFSYAKACLDPYEYIDENFNDLKLVYTDFQRRLFNTCSMEFSDLLQYAHNLIKNNSTVLKNYEEKFQAIVVDEFQDTSCLQFEIVRLLAIGHRRITLVGDKNQLIYAFQGANAQNFNNFKKYFQSGTSEVNIKSLKTNYRSTGPIIHGILFY